MSLIRFSLLMLFLSISSVAMARFETPTLRLQAFEELKLPPQLTRSEINSLLTTASKELYDYAFVDMGSMSDFMHAHIVFRPIDPMISKPKVSLSSIHSKFDWSKLQLEAFLVHTQEYDFLRPDRSYIGSFGPLDPLARNWIIWPSSMSKPVTAAHLLAPKYEGEPRPHTVRVSDLDPELFGKNPDQWEYSFYFFRVDCSHRDKLTEAEFMKSSLIEVKVGGERVCLNIVNFHCRNHPEDHSACGESQPMESYYSFGDSTD